MTPHRRKTQRLAAYGLILNAGDILLCRLSVGCPSGGKWTLPGGGLEFGEHPEDTMIREVREETGLMVASQGLLRVESEVFDFEHKDFHALRFYYRAIRIGGEIRRERNGSTDDCAWVSLSKVREVPTVEIVQRGIDLVV